MVSRPNPPWNSASGSPSSTKWSDATQYARASSRPAAERMPRATSGAAQALSLIGAPWRGLTPHSVHHSGRSDRP